MNTQTQAQQARDEAIQHADEAADIRQPLPDDVKEAIYACAQLISYVSNCNDLNERRESGHFPQFLKRADDKTQALSEKYKL